MTLASRRALLTGLGAAVLTGAAADPAHAAATDVTTAATYLRTSPSWAGGQIVLLAAGTPVTRTGRVSGSWVETTTGGRTGWLCTVYLAPAPVAAPAPAPKDSRTTVTTATWRRFEWNGMGSSYHVFADGIDWGSPVGVLWFLDGDYFYGSQSRVMRPDGAGMRAIAAEANRRNLVCVAVDSPDIQRPGLGCTWWYDMGNTASYFRAFAAELNRRHRFDLRRQWLYGYSGGAELITMALMAREQNTWGFQGGGAVILGGGDPPSNLSTAAMPAGFTAMRATWVVGSLDDAGDTIPATWSALDAARQGQAFYAARGFTNARLSVLPGLSHQDYDLAAVLRAPLDAAGLPRVR